MYLWGPQPEALVSFLRQRWSPEEALAAAGTVAARALLDFHYRMVLRGGGGLGLKQRSWTPQLV